MTRRAQKGPPVMQAARSMNREAVEQFAHWLSHCWCFGPDHAVTREAWSELELARIRFVGAVEKAREQHPTEAWREGNKP